MNKSRRRHAAPTWAAPTRTGPQPPPQPTAASKPRPAALVVLLVALACALLAAGLKRVAGSRHGVHAGTLPHAESDASPRLASRADEGPAFSGEFEATEIELPIPSAMLNDGDCNEDFETWRFEGRSRTDVSRIARASGADEAQVARIGSLARCDPGGCSVDADDALFASIGQSTRSALYLELRRSPENRMQTFPFLRATSFAPWHEMQGLSPRARELLARGTWVMQGHHAFSDLSWLCRSLPPGRERLDALRVLATRYSLDVRVRVPQTGELEPMVRYWSTRASAERVRDVFESARGGHVNARDLLPPMPRTRLDTFAPVGGIEYDCIWSAMNFFARSSRDEEPFSRQKFTQRLRARYREVPLGEARFGDVLALTTHDGSVTHVVSVIAGDVVFTKNGGAYSRPWAFMHLDDVRLHYAHTLPRLYRLR